MVTSKKTASKGAISKRRRVVAGWNRQVPRVLPWANWEEWKWVYESLYSRDDRYRREVAVMHCWAWRLRGGLPHAVECTAQLVACRDRYDVCSANESSRIEHERLELSMIVTRSVNGIVDQSQRATRVLPIASLARSMSLPEWLVDARHQATHNTLPSIEVLRSAATELLEYLRMRYWSRQARALARTNRSLVEAETLPASTLARVGFVRDDSEAWLLSLRKSSWPGLSAALLDDRAAALLSADSTARRRDAERAVRRCLSRKWVAADDDDEDKVKDSVAPIGLQVAAGRQIFRLWQQAIWVWHNDQRKRVNVAALANQLAATFAAPDAPARVKRSRPATSLEELEHAIKRCVVPSPAADSETTEHGVGDGDGSLRVVWKRRTHWAPSSIGTIVTSPTAPPPAAEHGKQR